MIQVIQVLFDNTIWLTVLYTQRRCQTAGLRLIVEQHCISQSNDQQQSSFLLNVLVLLGGGPLDDKDKQIIDLDLAILLLQVMCFSTCAHLYVQRNDKSHIVILNSLIKDCLSNVLSFVCCGKCPIQILSSIQTLLP
jgi:hypothetical protein